MPALPNAKKYLNWAIALGGIKMQTKRPLKAKTPLKSKASLKARTALKLSGKPKARKPLPLWKVADKVSSRYIRIRDSEWVADGWYGICITCSKTGLVAYIDAAGKLRFTRGWDNGHFVSRGHWITRYEEENCNLQCAFRCNKMRSGERDKYRVALRIKYGEGVPEKLEALADNHPSYRPKKKELEEIIHDATEELNFYLKDKDGSPSH